MATTARDAMTKDVITVSPSTPLADVARMFSEDRISGAPVVDSTERLVGIVSRTDVITGLLEASVEATTPEMRSLLGIGETEEDEPEDGGDVPEPESSGAVVEDVMDGDPATASPDTPLTEIARRMARERLHRVVVTQDARVVGILTSLDLLGHFPAVPRAASHTAKARAAKRPKARAAAPKAKAKGKGGGGATRPKAKRKAAPRAGGLRTRR